MFKLLKKIRVGIFILLISPCIYLLSVDGVFNHGHLESEQVAVLDNNKTTLSRKLIMSLRSVPAVKVVMVNDRSSLIKMIRKGSAFAYIELPENFERDVLSGANVSISMAVNGQFMTVSKNLRTKLLSVLKPFTGAVDLISLGYVSASDPSTLKKAAMPLTFVTDAMHNKHINYLMFMSMPVCACYLQIVIAILSALSFYPGELRKKDRIVCRKRILIRYLYTLPFLMVLSVAVSAFYVGRYTHIDLSLMLVCSSILLAVAVHSFVYLVSTLLRSEFKTYSIMSVFFGPAMSFAGVTFPVHAMCGFASFYSRLLPSTYFIDVECALIRGLNSSVLDARLINFVLYTAVILMMLALKLSGNKSDRLVLREVE